MTSFDASERYAAGNYVFASRAPDGLPVWTEKNREVRRRDIVLWVNIGMHSDREAQLLPAWRQQHRSETMAFMRAVSDWQPK